MVLLDRLKDGPSREWYLRASVEYGWSRNVLTHHISSQLREREGKALTITQGVLGHGAVAGLTEKQAYGQERIPSGQSNKLCQLDLFPHLIGGYAG
jgi:hypothetical protein